MARDKRHPVTRLMERARAIDATQGYPHGGLGGVVRAWALGFTPCSTLPRVLQGRAERMGIVLHASMIRLAEECERVRPALGEQIDGVAPLGGR